MFELILAVQSWLLDVNASGFDLNNHTSDHCEPAVALVHLDSNFNAKTTSSRASHPSPSTEKARAAAARAYGKAIS